MWVWAGLIWLSLLNTAQTQAPTEDPPQVQFKIGSWVPRLDGSLKFSESPFVGDRLHLGDELGLDDFSPVSSFELETQIDENLFGIRFRQFHFAANGTLQQPKRFDETVLPPGPIHSEIDIRDLFLDFDRRFQSGSFELWGGGSLRYFFTEPSFSTPSTPRDGDNLGAFFPELRLRGIWALHSNFSFTGVAAVGGMNAFDTRSRSYAFDAGFQWQFTRSATLSLGYRLESVSVRSTLAAREDNFVRYLLDGPFLAVEFRF